MAENIAEFECNMHCDASGACSLKPTNAASLYSYISPISMKIHEAITTDTTKALSLLERECNAYGNQIDQLDTSSCRWQEVPVEDLQIKLSPSCADRVSQGAEDFEVVKAWPMTVTPEKADGDQSKNTHRATSSPLLSFRTGSGTGVASGGDQGDVLAVVGIHVIITFASTSSSSEQDLAPLGQYDYLQIASLVAN